MSLKGVALKDIVTNGIAACSHQKTDHDLWTLELAVFAEPDLSQVILVFRLKVERRHVVEDNRYDTQCLLGVVKGNLLSRRLVFDVECIQETVDRVLMCKDALITVQIVYGLELARWERESRQDEVAKQRMGNHSKADAVKECPKNELRADCADVRSLHAF